MVSQEIIDRIRESTDIVSVVEEYFPLSRAGANYKALCPFHHEKTPSFIISPEKQIYHCFGCGESGNVYNFIMHMEKLDFMDVLQRLADRTGIKLDFEKDKDYQKKRKTSEQIIELNKRAAEFYAKILQSQQGKKALHYLKDRGVNDEMIEMFHLGYAPAGNQFIEAALKSGVNESILVKSGLAGKDDRGRAYSKFRDRVMFPILDDMGHVRGFGGRIMEKNPNMAKYLNTAQTEVFEKKKMMYGFYYGKDAIKESKKILLLEGYMDVIAAHQFGIKNAVAALGTALTAEHVYKLKHWVDEIILSFDADEAGSKATARGLDVILNSEIFTKVCQMPAGNDPEDIIRRDKEEFLKYLNEAKPVMNWRIEYSMSLFKDVDDATERKVRVVRDLAAVVNKLSPIRKAEVVKDISSKLNISESAVLQEISRITKRSRKGSYIREKEQNPETSFDDNASKKDRLIKEVLHVVIKFPQYINEVEKLLTVEVTGKNYYKLLFEYVKVFEGDIHKMLEQADDDVRNVVAELSLSDLNTTGNPVDHLNDLKIEYKKMSLEQRFELLSQEINSLLKDNKTIEREKKEEYDKLKKALKGAKRK
jgi:DNA primase